MTQTEFGLLLANAKEAGEGYEIGQMGDKTKRHGIMVMNWNIDGLVSSLQRMYLLEREFIYSHIDIRVIDIETIEVEE